MLKAKVIVISFLDKSFVLLFIPLYGEGSGSEMSGIENLNIIVLDVCCKHRRELWVFSWSGMWLKFELAYTFV